MSKACRCDVCEKYFDGLPDTQVGHSEEAERRIRFYLGLKFSPESPEAQFYVKDLCPDCAKLYCEFWSLGPKIWRLLLGTLKKELKR